MTPSKDWLQVQATEGLSAAPPILELVFYGSNPSMIRAALGLPFTTPSQGRYTTGAQCALAMLSARP